MERSVSPSRDLLVEASAATDREFPATGLQVAVKGRRSSGLREKRGAGKRGLAQGWIPLRKQEWRLLRLLEQGPERTPFRVRGPTLLRAQERQPLRQQDR